MVTKSCAEISGAGLTPNQPKRWSFTASCSGASLTPLAVQAFRDQLRIASSGPYLFPSDLNKSGHQTTLKTVWHKTLKRAKIPYFRIYDLRSTYATRLSAGGVADEWVTQMLRQGDAKVPRGTLKTGQWGTASKPANGVEAGH